MFAHVDADSFFASVLQRKYPHLKGKPLFALGMGGSCIIAASYEAKAFGVKTGMPVREARKLCPNAFEMPSDFRETGIASKQIEDMLQNVCPLLEQYSIDEWFLDLTSCLGGTPVDLMVWARDLQRRINGATDITVSIGVGPTKLLAKMAGEYRKPAGATVVGNDKHPSCRDAPAGRLYDGKHTNVGDGANVNGIPIETFLRDRPAAAIPGIGYRRKIQTEQYGWHTAWDFATAAESIVQTLFGKQGPELQRELKGEALFGVSIDRTPPKSVSRTRTFRATRDETLLWAHIIHHTQYVLLRMRKHGLACQGVSIWLRDKDYKHYGCTKRLPQVFNTEETLTPYLRACLTETFDPNISYNQAGMCLWGLVPAGMVQSSLFDDMEKSKTDEQLQRALDTVRRRFGREAITRGSSLLAKEAARPGLEVPLYE